jgi:hypothetical protein
MAVKLAIAKEVRHLTERMNTGVGTTRADYTRGTSAKRRDRVFQNRLNRPAVRLDLPAAVIRAVVLNRQFDIHDRLTLSFGMRRRGVHRDVHGLYKISPRSDSCPDIRRRNENARGSIPPSPLEITILSCLACLASFMVQLLDIVADQYLGDLHRVQRCAFPQVVRYHPKIETVGNR